MSNWSFKKVQGDQINVNNYIVTVFFDTVTEYSNYLAFDKGNAEKKRVIVAGINALYLLLKFYKAIRKGNSLQEKKITFEMIYDKIQANHFINDGELFVAVDFLCESMFLIGFTDINWEFKDYEKSL